MKKKNVLVFGSTGYIGRKFIEETKNIYNIFSISRKPTNQPNNIIFDFLRYEEDILNLTSRIPDCLHSLLFLQGMNPLLGAHEINQKHFSDMLTVNLVVPTLILQNVKEKLSNTSNILFISSIAKQKGSYDPSYASAKSGLIGLIASLANAYKASRFNSISLGLVENSTVFQNMTNDFRDRHTDHMFNKKLIDVNGVIRVMNEIIENENIHRSDICIDGGYV